MKRISVVLTRVYSKELDVAIAEKEKEGYTLHQRGKKPTGTGEWAVMKPVETDERNREAIMEPIEMEIITSGNNLGNNSGK